MSKSELFFIAGIAKVKTMSYEMTVEENAWDVDYKDRVSKEFPNGEY